VFIGAITYVYVATTYLVELGSLVVVAGDEERDAEGAHAAGLRKLLRDARGALDKLRDGDLVLVHKPVLLHLLAALGRQHAEVGAQPGVGHADVLRRQRDLLHGGLVGERRGGALLGGDHNAVGGLDAQRGEAIADGRQGVVNLGELARGRERRQRV